MKHLLVLFLLLATAMQGMADSRHLVRNLLLMKEHCEVTPDSFHSHVRRLKSEIAQQNDSVSKAVYRATLAHLLMQNKGLAQAWNRKTESHPDSTEEWSRKEYMMYSAQFYRQAMQDMEQLHATPVRKWMPLAKKGRDKTYGTSMLPVIWQAMWEDFRQEDREEYGLPSHGSLIAFYQSHGMREAALSLKLDSIRFCVKDKEQKAAYRSLIGEYRDLKSCDRVYEELFRLEFVTKEMKAVLDEGLALYPHSIILRNCLAELESPTFSYHTELVYYPEVTNRIVLRYKNMQGVTQTIYRMPDEYVCEGGVSLQDDVRRHGVLQQKNLFDFAAIEPERRQDDTIEWKTPGLGVYAMVMEARTGAKLSKEPEQEVHLFYVSRLNFMTNRLPNGKNNTMVVDARSGEPVAGATVVVSKQGRNGEYNVAGTYITDAYGKVCWSEPEKERLRTQIVAFKGEDNALMAMGNKVTMFPRYTNSAETTGRKGRIYTDRSIYRPGQTIYVAAVAYDQKDWEMQTAEGVDIDLTLYNGDGQKVMVRKLRTDEFGVANDSLTIPQSAKPGFYSLRSSLGNYSVRVEEYRRPTFEVVMDPAPAMSLPADSIVLTGYARTYSGVPVAGARVAANATFRNNFWVSRDFYSSEMELDTVTTDAGGRFALTVPLAEPKEALLYGARLTVIADVLSQTGETQQGRADVPLLFSRPFILHGNIPYKQDKDMLKPWKFSLQSSTGSDMQGNVDCRILQGEKEVCRFSASAGRDFIPRELAAIPSGRYMLKAEYVQGQDTARWSDDFSLLSINDTHLFGGEKVRLYCQCDEFQVGKPARVQLGTTLRDAWVYYTVSNNKDVFQDTLLCLHDTAFVCEIPYREEYGQGVVLDVMTYWRGNVYSDHVLLKMPLPDKKLTMRWDTFRDMLRPGQKEEWKLTLLRPDGTPASANVLLSMYDASLDALEAHGISIHPQLYHRIGEPSHSSNGYYQRNWTYNIWMNYVQLPVPSLAPCTFNPDFFFSVLQVSRGGGGVFYSVAAKPMTMKKEVAGAMQAYRAEGEDAANLTGRIGGLDAEAAEETEDAESPKENKFAYRGKADAAFSELAFFMPMLRTDAKGTASIAFALPESLTSWHLTGFAHTRDLMTVCVDDTITAQKELMAELYLPRFLRQGDEASFTASIRNISDRKQTGKATCLVLDAETEKVIKRYPVTFSLEAGADTTYTLLYNCARASSSLIVKWLAESADCSDGEQRHLPVLSDMEHVTETRAFYLDKPGTTRFPLTSLYAGNNASATGRGMMVEYTTRPAWLAMKALPSLFVPHCQNILCLTSAYYATTLAQHILRHTPDTEWLADSLRYLPMLSLDNRMSQLTAISALQRPDGSFAWFPGMKGSAYMTREVAYMLVRLQQMGIDSDAATVASDRILGRAMEFLAAEVHRQVVTMKEHKDKTIGLAALRYLYLLSSSGFDKDEQTRKDANYLVSLLSTAENLSVENAAIAAIVLSRFDKSQDASRLMKSVDRRLRQPDGCYVAYPGGSFTSIDRKLQTHVQIMEAVYETMPDSTSLLAGMTQWLLLQKRTQQWDDAVTTANAVHALLMGGTQMLTDRTVDVLKLHDVNGTSKFKTPATDMGYLRDSVAVKAPTAISVEKRTGGLSWGAVYATYDIPIDSVRSDWQGFRIRREIASETTPAIGDRIHVRYTITADRDYDFVCLRMPRPAAAEPVSQLSGYRYQNGLGYYLIMRDTGSEAYFDSMPRGTYVIEEDWLIARSGNYQTSSATIECLYAPEFKSHTQGERLVVRSNMTK